MFCTSCGNILTGKPTRCPYCGARVETPLNEKPQTPPKGEAPIVSEPGAFQNPPDAKQPRKNGAFRFGLLGFLFAAASLAVLLIAIPVFLRKPLKLLRGVSLLDAQDYAGAHAVFSELEGYAPADALRGETARGLAYLAAVDRMERGDYRGARDAFRLDPDFADARARIEACDRALCLEDARLLSESGDYAQALALLENAQGDAEADALIVVCRRALADRTCAALMERGAYAEALELLRSGDGALLPDCDARIRECENRITYRAASEALAEGRRADAYKLFLSLGDWSDAQARANDCPLDRPETGELFHDEAYQTGNLVLTVRPPSDGTDTFFRIYAIVKDEPVKVADLYIRSGDSISTSLPEGIYLFKSAYGAEWFGESELFGDGGVYRRLLSAPDIDLFALEKGFEYTLVLRGGDGSGNVDAIDEAHDAF